MGGEAHTAGLCTGTAITCDGWLSIQMEKASQSPSPYPTIPWLCLGLCLVFSPSTILSPEAQYDLWLITPSYPPMCPPFFASLMWIHSLFPLKWWHLIQCNYTLLPFNPNSSSGLHCGSAWCHSGQMAQPLLLGSHERSLVTLIYTFYHFKTEMINVPELLHCKDRMHQHKHWDRFLYIENVQERLIVHATKSDAGKHVGSMLQGRRASVPAF